MAVYSNVDRQAIDELVDQWRERSLIGDASVLHPERFPSTWSADSLRELNDLFWGNLLVGEEAGGSFESKWQVQLEAATPEIRLLAAEILLIYYLITETVGHERKVELINRTIHPDFPELQIQHDSLAFQALQQWIANPGMYYNTRQDVHVGFLMDWALHLKRESPESRATLLHDNPWSFAEFTAFEVEGHQRSPQMPNIICHLLYPRYFERIASPQHKTLIENAFIGLSTAPAEAGQDEKLYSIRQALKQRLPDWEEADRDYYSPKLEPIWRPVSRTHPETEALDPQTALEFKKQIVFYGPPGTGKTYQANRLAETMIRSAALDRWGITAYFSNPEAVEQAILNNVTRLQMHPSYGYEEFMVGLRLAPDGGTTYQLGALPRLVQRMQSEQRQLGNKALPHVLILDEINRTDLSTMFGEAFSAMERDKRDTPMELFADGTDGQPIEFIIPSNLYIIGTMNEIDQSVEALDFAMRRRFFWIAAPYVENDLYDIWRNQWEEQDVPVEWDRALPQLNKLAQSITRLNTRICESPELGKEYELGAAVFSDVPFFIKRQWAEKSYGRLKGLYLWDEKDRAQAPLNSLWSLSVEPVLAQYLAGSDLKDEQLEEFRQILFS